MHAEVGLQGKGDNTTDSHTCLEVLEVGDGVPTVGRITPFPVGQKTGELKSPKNLGTISSPQEVCWCKHEISISPS